MSYEIELQKAKKLLADGEISPEMRITACIRQANNAFNNRNFIAVKGILVALKEKYPFIENDKDILNENSDWLKVKNQDKETLSSLMFKLPSLDLTNSSQSNEMNQKNKEKRVGFFGKLFGKTNPSHFESGSELDFNPQKPQNSSKKPINDSREFSILHYSDIEKVYNEYLKKPGYDEAPLSEKFIPTSCNMVTKNYVFNINNRTSWIAVHNMEAPKFTVKDAIGWKFHIGLDEEPDNLRKGLDIVCEVLMKHQVTAFKMTSPHSSLNNGLQAGKQATIYYELDKNKDWKIILEEIEQNLKAAKIKPSPKLADSEKHLGTSEYIGYRNDTDQSGKYIEADTVKEYNISGREDPFTHILTNKEPSAKLR